jgi:DNA-binding transcriptional regulator YiaG
MTHGRRQNGNRGGLQEVCANCDGTEFEIEWKEQSFPYGSGDEAVELSVTVPVHVCKTCAFQFTGEDAEDLRHEAVCHHLGVMTPSEIIGIRERYGMARAEFAELSKIGTASLARWETGIIVQNAANDQLLYLLRFEDNVSRLRSRAALQNEAARPMGSGQAVITEADVTILELESGGRSDRIRSGSMTTRVRIHRSPMRGRFRTISDPETGRAAVAGWSL